MLLLILSLKMCITDQIPGGGQFGLLSWASQTEAINKLAYQAHSPAEAGTQSWAEDNHWALKTESKQRSDVWTQITHSDPSVPSYHTHLILHWNTAFTSLTNSVPSDTHLLHKLSLGHPLPTHSLTLSTSSHRAPTSVGSTCKCVSSIQVCSSNPVAQQLCSMTEHRVKFLGSRSEMGTSKARPEAVSRGCSHYGPEWHSLSIHIPLFPRGKKNSSSALTIGFLSFTSQMGHRVLVSYNSTWKVP